MASTEEGIKGLAKLNLDLVDNSTMPKFGSFVRQTSLLSSSSTCSSLYTRCDSNSSDSSETSSSQRSSMKCSRLSSAGSETSRPSTDTVGLYDKYVGLDRSNTSLGLASQRAAKRRIRHSTTATASLKFKDGSISTRSTSSCAGSYDNSTASEIHTHPQIPKNESKRACTHHLLSGSETESVSDCGRLDSVESKSTSLQSRMYNDIKNKYLNHIEGSESDCKLKTHNFKAENNLFDETNYSKVAIQERCCPLRDCDSLGHLGGSLENHFTKEACPMYHNKTVNDCKAAFIRRYKLNEERLKSKAKEISLKTNSITLEPDCCRERELRIVLENIRPKKRISSLNNVETMDSPVNREPRLGGFASECDIQLFQDAQAIASEYIEKDQDLPYSMGTKTIEIGTFDVEVWYQSPYPEDFSHVPKLFICEYCLHYMKSSTTRRRHQVKCVWRYPPGEEIYRHRGLSVWEVDGKKYREYCQNLCLLAKFFLDHKTLHDNVEPFFFYVMTVQDSKGCHAVGYFSKEKNSSMNYNVSCILIFPHYQRKGYGRLLIDFSYLLTRVEGKIGTPEKPLSDLGLISYRSYWKDVLLNFLHNFTDKELSMKDISQETGINTYDIVSTLQALSMIKYWKGKHIILKKQNIIEEYKEREKKHGTSYKQINPLCLKWIPIASR